MKGDELAILWADWNDLLTVDLAITVTNLPFCGLTGTTFPMLFSTPHGDELAILWADWNEDIAGHRSLEGDELAILWAD